MVGIGFQLAADFGEMIIVYTAMRIAYLAVVSFLDGCILCCDYANSTSMCSWNGMALPGLHSRGG
jgi:hypothetical protein